MANRVIKHLHSFLPFLLLFTASSAYAQDENKPPGFNNQEDPLRRYYNSKIEVGMKGGLGINTALFDPILGSDVSYEPNRISSFLFYIKLGEPRGLSYGSEPGFINKRSSLIISDTVDLEFTFDLSYLSIPVFLHYASEASYLSKALHQQWYIQIGAGPNFLLSANSRITTNQIQFEQIESIYDELAPIELDLLISAGTKVIIGNNTSAILEVRVNRSLSSFNDSFLSPQINMINLGGSIMLGITSSIL